MPTNSYACTKIVCTLGPASSSPKVIRSLIDAGMDVARINFSHGTQDEHAEVIRTVRRIAAEARHPVAILGDLQGPRIRVGTLAEPVMLPEGSDAVLAPEDVARAGEIPITYDALADDVKEGDRVLMDDGLIDVVVLAVEHPRVRTRVVHGGLLRSHEFDKVELLAVAAPASRCRPLPLPRRIAPTSPSRWRRGSSMSR